MARILPPRNSFLLELVRCNHGCEPLKAADLFDAARNGSQAEHDETL